MPDNPAIANQDVLYQELAGLVAIIRSYEKILIVRFALQDEKTVPAETIQIVLIGHG
jgi:hypothetical protein